MSVPVRLQPGVCNSGDPWFILVVNKTFVDFIVTGACFWAYSYIFVIVSNDPFC